MRISGVNIPKEKRAVIALTYIFGIGKALSQEILKEVKIDESKRISELSDAEVKKLRDFVEKKHRIEGELRRDLRDSVDRLKRINCYRGVRHKKQLPVRGQNTKTNSRTVRGNVRKSAGSGRKGAPAPK
jgi:small subunit ribosomal protein S13